MARKVSVNLGCPAQENERPRSLDAARLITVTLNIVEFLFY